MLEWQQVPRRPTPTMWNAGKVHVDHLIGSNGDEIDYHTAIGVVIAIYDDMIAAAPAPDSIDYTAAHVQTLEMQVIRLRAERDTLKRENALLRSGIDPDSEYLDGFALGMNVQFIGEKVGEHLDEVPVC